MSRSAVVYVRVSSSRQVENYSLDVQEDACRGYCRSNGWPIARVFREEGESAKSADRTQLTALMDYCREHRAQIAAVVVHSMSRWSRDTGDHFALRGLLAKWGIALRSATEQMIDDSPEGELIEAVVAGVSKYERRQLTRRTTGGMRKALESGRWTHRAPLGFLNGTRGVRGGPSLVPNPATADLVRTMFEMFVNERLPEHEVRRRLAQRGFRMPDGKPVLLQTVSKTLRNPAYCGRLVQRAWDITGRGDWEPLVSESLFDRAQARIAGHGAPKVHVIEHDDFTLRGFARCGVCDKPLTGAWSKGRAGRLYGFYWCWHCRPAVRVSKPVLDGVLPVSVREPSCPAGAP
jgi:DNA invertase Pin-like site-specific DNA recombinase